MSSYVKGYFLVVNNVII